MGAMEGGVSATFETPLLLLSWPPHLWLPGSILWLPEPVFLGLSSDKCLSKLRLLLSPRAFAATELLSDRFEIAAASGLELRFWVAVSSG
ncbi:uncharacterized protein DS421_9g275780 [Arachis hypogaea]|nr:uncharacterized protein DS421_9g275780 [Arachis hypogaea]